MELDFFQREISRAKEKWGEKAFSRPDEVMIYRFTLHLTDQQFESILDQFIASRPHTKPPQPFDFREAANKGNYGNKQEDILRFPDEEESIFTQEEKMEMLDFAKKVAMGLVPKHIATSYENQLNKIIYLKSKITCQICISGLVFALRRDDPARSSPTMFLCSCRKGSKRRENFPQWAGIYNQKFIPEEIWRREQVNKDEGPSIA